MDLNDYIIKNVDNINDLNFLRAYADSEIYFSLDTENQGLEDGPLQLSKGKQLNLQLAKFEYGIFAIFYAKKNHPDLSHKFAGIPLIRAIRLVSQLESADGILIQSDQDAWFAANKETLKQVAGQIRVKISD